jgi:acetyl-CoA carboxylase biotin carboxyl carrier protein
MKIDEIAKVAKLMKQFELTEFSLESEEIKLCMKRGGETVMVPAPAYAPPAAMPAAPVQGTSAAEAAQSGGAAAPAAAEAQAETIDSPIVGTFYAAPAPDAPSFVKVGDEVNEDTVVCIVEAMKVMNEIRAERRGRIRRVLVENAKPVEFGQPLFELDAV